MNDDGVDDDVVLADSDSILLILSIQYKVYDICRRYIGISREFPLLFVKITPKQKQIHRENRLHLK